MFGVVPAPWDRLLGEHASERFGHIVWMWSIEIVRRDLRNRITECLDAGVAIPAAGYFYRCEQGVCVYVPAYIIVIRVSATRPVRLVA
ncbi:hypothetical protein [Corynebacterium sp. zg331]|uniref:hypothetical protein n=1 Tax=unclassified Corynebacterium TaxID=2624378 RepID=UPI00351BB373